MFLSIGRFRWPRLVFVRYRALELRYRDVNLTAVHDEQLESAAIRQSTGRVTSDRNWQLHRSIKIVRREQGRLESNSWQAQLQSTSLVLHMGQERFRLARPEALRGLHRY